ncbi:MAG: hydroxyacid dehydrogenase [Planctomycetes bacterium]|nr:hydroxyacid dehydrogenase [Planctomycetota bacterium]
MKVLIADKFAPEGVAALRELGCDVTMDPSLKNDQLKAALGETASEVLIVRSTRVEADMLDASPNLRLIIRAGSGYDTIAIDAAAQRDIRVCNCPGMNAVAVAELTIGLMIALDRRIVDETLDLRQGVWNKKEYSKARGLKGSTLGLVGLGRIGYEVAKRARAFDMNLIYSDVVDFPQREKELGARKVSFEQLLKESDFVALHVPGGADTKHLIGEPQLKTMKPTAFLLNCSRGGIVDEKALAVAIREGVIAGAALDVYEIEPGATDTEFTDAVIKVPRVYGTHHIGASTDQAQSAVGEEAVRIVRVLLEDGEFINCVNSR